MSGKVNRLYFIACGLLLSPLMASQVLASTPSIDEFSTFAEDIANPSAYDIALHNAFSEAVRPNKSAQFRFFADSSSERSINERLVKERIDLMIPLVIADRASILDSVERNLTLSQYVSVHETAHDLDGVLNEIRDLKEQTLTAVNDAISEPKAVVGEDILLQRIIVSKNMRGDAGNLQGVKPGGSSFMGLFQRPVAAGNCGDNQG